MSDLQKAAQALIDRWHTPNWAHDSVHTGVLIDALSKALTAHQEQSGWVGLTNTQQEALTRIPILAWEIYDHWDEGRDAKVGKCLRALAGQLKNYAPRYTAIHDAIEALRAKNAVPDRVQELESENERLRDQVERLAIDLALKDGK